MTALPSKTLSITKSSMTPAEQALLKARLKDSARGLFSECVALKDGHLVIPGRLFMRSRIPLGTPVELAIVQNAILIRAAQRLVAHSWGHTKTGDILIPLQKGMKEADVSAILNNHALFIGKGALLVINQSEMPAELGYYRTLTPFGEKRMATYDAKKVQHKNSDYKVDPAKLLAWRHETATRGYVRVEGGPAEVAGFSIEDQLQYIKYNNGLLIKRATSDKNAAHEVKRGRRQPEGHPEDFRARVWVPRDLLDQAGTAFNVLATADSLFVVPVESEIAKACPEDLSLRRIRSHPRAHPKMVKLDKAPEGANESAMATQAWFRLGGLLVNTSLQAAALPYSSTAGGNHSVHPVPAEGDRLQVQGDWLADWGFTVGTKYNVVDNMLQRSGIMVEAANEGSFTVTSNAAGQPKLYIPARLLSGYRGAKSISIIGTTLGLVLRKSR